MLTNEKMELIKKECININSVNPIEIALYLMSKDYVSMHGPEHHMIDGASVLTAYYNKTKSIDLIKALDELQMRAILMPVATCGKWGVCGSASSVGAALAIINNTGPLSDNDDYKNNLALTSKCLEIIGNIGGPRCCKRNAYISITQACKLIKEKYNVELFASDVNCSYSMKNPTCLKNKCPFYKQERNLK